VDVVEHAQAAGEVELPDLERQRRGVALEQRDVRRRGGSGGFEEVDRLVDADDLADERCERERQGARSAARVERALAPGERDEQLANALGERLGSLPLKREPVLDGAQPTTSRCARGQPVLSPQTSS